MRLNVALLVVLGLSLLGAPALSQPVDDHLIVPGERIGPLRVGISITDATAVMGTPKPAVTKFQSIVLQVPEGSLGFEWPPSPEAKQQGAGPRDGFLIITNKAGVVYEVQGPFDRRYHTAEGLRVGSKPSDVMATLGTPARQVTSGHEHYSIYDQRGIVLLIQDNRQASNYGLVNGVWVFAPRASP